MSSTSGSRRRFAESLRAWQEQNAARLVPGQVDTRTASGLEIAPLYTPADLPLDSALPDGLGDWYRERLGFPGEAPFTRGPQPGMYRERPWVMGMYSGRASPAETNRRIRSLLERGQKGFSVALDLPTQVGLDSDHPLALGEVGRVGVPIDTLRDMQDLLAGIPLDQVRQIRTTANAIGPIALALFVAGAESQGHSAKSFKVMFQNDVLKEYVARGTWIFPPARGLRFSVDVVEYCAQELPNWEPIEFCGYHIRDSGSTAVQEVALALSNGIAYIDEALSRGLSIDQFAHSIFLFLAADLDLFEEVAKFRAARRIWCRLIGEHYGAKHAESCALNIFCYTLGSALTAQEPLNNVARVAYEALAAALGGVQTLATSSYDEALGLPSDEAVRTSLRTQQILAFETGVTRTADPLGGAFYVEYLTDRIEESILAYMKRVEEQGGGLAAIESGWVRREIEEEAYRKQRRIEEGQQAVVGVNRFAESGEARYAAMPAVGADTEAEQLERLARVRAERDAARVVGTLAEVRRAASEGRNTVPSILDAIRAYASVGEITNELASVWGRHQQRI
ncbi:MAG: methylmalonyl-CoA mutase [Deltaproteobacteria bacterium]|nr:methylmalonyl-CoA mutase [Deltaproteobacteria bacterium]